MTATLEGDEWSAARHGRTLTPVPILQEAGWAPGPVWRGGASRPHRDSIQLFYVKKGKVISLQVWCGPEVE